MQSILNICANKHVFREIFLPSYKDVGNCRKVTLYPGMSIVIPAGTIHAVRTMGASVAFGANIILEKDMLSKFQLWISYFTIHFEFTVHVL